MRGTSCNGKVATGQSELASSTVVGEKNNTLRGGKA